MFDSTSSENRLTSLLAKYSSRTCTLTSCSSAIFNISCESLETIISSIPCTFLRVLGAGDGKQRLSNGNVTNAGFTVGSRIVQANGNLGNNKFATSGPGAPEGRTYFLFQMTHGIVCP